MEHNEIRHKLSEYIDGSIAAEEREAVEEHLKTCASCSDALRELRKTIEHIKSLEEVDSPAWMTQKIMAKVRSEEAERTGWFRKLFFPLSVKVPIQAVAVLFLAVGAFYIYRSIQPSYEPAEAPVRVFEAKKEARSVPAESREEKSLRRRSQPSEQVQQTPGYKALDMKQEYEKPAPPALADKMAPAPTPASPADQPMMAKKKAQGYAPQAAAPAKMQEQSAPSAGVTSKTETRGRSLARSLNEENQTYTSGTHDLEKVILERYPNSKPRVIVTYKVIDSHKIKLAEERFNADGERHGIQKEYYESGQVKTEAQYGYGKLEWYREFSPDGVKKMGKSDYDWIWLK